MSTFDYLSKAETARRLITKFGRSVTILSRDTSFPAGEEWEDGGLEAETTKTVDAVFLDELLMGSITISDDDRAWLGMILIAPPEDGTDLRRFHVIRDGTRHVELVSCLPLEPGDADVLYIAKKKGGA